MKCFKFLLPLLLLASTCFAQSPTQNNSIGNITASSATCTLSNDTGCVVLPLPSSNRSSIAVTITGTFTGTLNFIGTNAGIPFSSSLAVSPLAGGSTVTSTTSTGTWVAQVTGLSVAGVRASSGFTGTAAVTITSSTAAVTVSGGSNPITNCTSTGGVLYESGSSNAATCTGNATLDSSGNIVVNSCTGCSTVAPLPPSVYSIIDDFGQSGTTNLIYGTQAWVTQTIGSAPVFNGVAGAYPNLGILNIATNSGATAGQGGALNIQGANVSAAGILNNSSSNVGWEIQWIFKIEQTTATRFRIGLSTSPNVLAPNTGIWLRYDTNSTYNDTHFIMGQSVGGVESNAVDTGIAVDTAWHRIKISSSVAGTTIWTLYDAAGAQQATGTQTITGTLSISPSVIIGTDTTAQKKCDVDYMSFVVTGLAR